MSHIAQKASTVANLVNTLKKNDAMGYTVIVKLYGCRFSMPAIYAPLSATSLAEYLCIKAKTYLLSTMI